MDRSLLLWVIFIIIVLFLLAFDLGVLHKTNREIGIKESLYTSLGYIITGVLFGAWIWFDQGAQKGAEYLTGFAIEKSLALDNIFLISLIFTYFAIPRKYQYRILFWGIVGVIVLRAMLIALGVALIASFAWILYLFAVFLIFTGIKMFFIIDNLPDIKSNPLLRFIRLHCNVTNEIRGPEFFVKVKKDKNNNESKWYITPLFLALILIECMDLIFAVDSVPAILAITTDTYIVYTSNIFAVLGLRALYFALDALLVRFKYLKYALAILLIFIGSKIFIAELLDMAKFPPVLALTITFTILAVGVIYSMYKTRKKN
ncbi:MAG: TerC family protein [Gammaproteobacteria bacterium]|jgi:tellurite resistance protein TerC|nr:TerC family protein [Gammaproteobacteria bacterium]